MAEAAGGVPVGLPGGSAASLLAETSRAQEQAKTRWHPAGRGGRRDPLGRLGGEGQQGSALEHAVILVNLGAVLSLDPFLITSSERRDVLATGTRGKQSPNAGSFLLDAKHPVITT